jgi:hypothetical protein
VLFLQYGCNAVEVMGRYYLLFVSGIWCGLGLGLVCVRERVCVCVCVSCVLLPYGCNFAEVIVGFTFFLS